MCVASVAITVVLGRSLLTLFSGEFTLAGQALIGLGFGVAACINSWVGYKFTAHRPTTRHTIQSYSRLDLADWNPLWIALAAGIGEELLFRGALQPIIGIWFSSALFVLAHTRAYQFTLLGKRTLIQAVGLLTASLVLGAIAKYVGLLASMIVHTAIDVAGLYSVRHASALPFNGKDSDR
jgi:membrane protease YdiL (CAAX protease family)